jgi:hypothetical protein
VKLSLALTLFPNKLIKTFASVPAPFAAPVSIVIVYFFRANLSLAIASRVTNPSSSFFDNLYVWSYSSYSAMIESTICGMENGIASHHTSQKRGSKTTLELFLNCHAIFSIFVNYLQIGLFLG